MAHGGSGSTPHLYTRTGDRGTTGLVGGRRVDKDSPRIGAYGTFDELAAHLGLVEALLPESADAHRALTRRLEHELFLAMSEIATAPDRPPLPHQITADHVARLEREIDRLEGLAPPLKSFVLPNGVPPAAELQVARTVARRAERELWALRRTEPVRDELLQWSNRLSDLLFAFARVVNHEAHWEETPPDYTA